MVINFLIFIERYGEASPVPKSLQELKIVEYDTTKYPFRKVVADILDVEESELSALHETEEGLKALREGASVILKN